MKPLLPQRGDSADSALVTTPLLAPIYEAATNPSLWPDVLAQIVCLLGAQSGLIFSHQARPEEHGLWVPYQCAEEALRSYAERYHAFDIWMQRGHELGVFVPGNVVTSDELLPRDELLSSVFYREHLSLYDIYDLCAGMLHDGSEPDIPRVHISIFRSKTMPLFGETEKALMAALIPHLRQATRIGFHTATLERRLEVTQAAVESLSPALVLLDAQGTVVFTNHKAQKLLAASDVFRMMAGKLVIKSRQQVELEALLRVPLPEVTMMGISRSTGKPNIWLIRVPMALSESGPPDARRPAVALLIHDSAAIEMIGLDGFAKVHDLTRAEARLLNLLLEHSSLPPVARALGLSIHTIRSQLRTIREKTGAHRQAELVRMLMSWPHPLN